MKYIALLCIGLVLSSCQPSNAGKDTWNPISKRLASLSIPALDLATAPIVKIYQINDYRGLQENWKWPGGNIYRQKLSPGKYFTESYSSPQGLLKLLSIVSPFKNTKFSKHQVQSTRDGQNNQIAYLLTPHKNDICFVASRNTDTNPQKDGATGGLLFVSLCQNQNLMDVWQLTQIGKSFVSAIAIKQDQETEPAPLTYDQQGDIEKLWSLTVKTAKRSAVKSFLLSGTWQGSNTPLIGTMQASSDPDHGIIETSFSDDPCEGTWQYDSGEFATNALPHGTWELSCQNGRSATGTYQAITPETGTAIGQDNLGNLIEMTYRAEN